MKRNIFKTHFGILALCGLLAGSCSIKENIIDTPTPSNINTEDDATSMVNGAYGILNDPNSFKYQGYLMMMMVADDLYCDVTNTGEIFSYSSRTHTAASVVGFWNAMFNLVRNANHISDVMDQKDFSEGFEQRMYGEAHFLRALAYYHLVRLYGGVPIVAEAVDANSDFYRPRNSVDEVYARIFDDLKAASALLPPQSQIPNAQLGRASKGAAQAFLASANLTFGNTLMNRGEDGSAYFAEAKLYADSVINFGGYTLLNDFADLFDVANENNAYNEVIFGARFQADAQRTGLGSAGSEFAFRMVPGQFHGITGNSPNGNGQAAIKVMPWVYDFYTRGEYEGDYRAEASYVSRGFQSGQGRFFVSYPFIPAEGEGTVAGVFCGKYLDPDGVDQRNNGNDLFLIRLAEIYLIKAEAENEMNGPTAEAYSAFNMIRARARKADGTERTMPADLATGLTQDLFRVKIFQEREAEFMGEGKRYFDLVRMRHPSDPSKLMFDYQFFEDLPTKPQRLPVYQGNNQRWSNKNAVYAPAIENTQQKHKIFPIPDQELRLNPKFGDQNTGW